MTPIPKECRYCGGSLKNENSPELKSEIVAEPIVGWRIWHVAKDVSLSLNIADMREMERRWKEGRNPFEGFSAPYLQSVGVNALWARPFIEACCNSSHLATTSSATANLVYGTGISVFRPGHTSRESHPVPEQHCTCGIWALKNEAQIIDAIVGYKSEHMAFGSVQIWGKIIECTEGFRAQYAKPLSISLVGVSEEEASEMAAAYECEVRVATDFPPAVEEKVTRRKKEQEKSHLAPGNYWVTTALPASSQYLPFSGLTVTNTSIQPGLPAGEPPSKKRILALFGHILLRTLKLIALGLLIIPLFLVSVPYMITGLLLMGRVGSEDWWFAHEPVLLVGRLARA